MVELHPERRSRKATESKDLKGEERMKKNNPCFAVIDPGSYEMSAIAARWTLAGDYVIEGFARGGARGIRKGIVTDIPSATDSIAELLAKLTERTGKRVREVYAGVTSPSVGMIPSSGVVLLSKYGREVTEKDIEQCVEVGSAIKLPIEIEPLHKIIRDYHVDGEKGIKNPVNLDGVKLGVEMNVVTINSSALRNMARCIAEAGFLPAGFVFSGLALSYRMVSDEDKVKGAALLDICKDITGAMVFGGGIMTGCKAFSMGLGELVSPDGGMIDESRVDVMTARVMSLPGWDRVSSGVMVTGDGAFNEALIESLEKSFKCPVKAGNFQTRPLEELPSETIAYAGGLGILDYLQELKHKEKISKSAFRRWYNRMTRFVEKYF